jgi:hypothetical protein
MDLLGIVGVASGSVAIPLSAVSTATSIAAISQGVSAQQAASDAAGGGGGGGGDPKEDPRLAKFSLRVSCPDVRELDGKIVVLRNGKVRRLLIFFLSPSVSQSVALPGRLGPGTSDIRGRPPVLWLLPRLSGRRQTDGPR